MTRHVVFYPKLADAMRPHNKRTTGAHDGVHTLCVHCLYFYTIADLSCGRRQPAMAHVHKQKYVTGVRGGVRTLPKPPCFLRPADLLLEQRSSFDLPQYVIQLIL